MEFCQSEKVGTCISFKNNVSFSNLMRSVVNNLICTPSHFHSTADENSCAKNAQQFVNILSHLMLPFASSQCFNAKFATVPVFLFGSLVP